MEEQHRQWALNIALGRRALGLAQKDLAARVGVTPSTVSRWESRDPNPKKRLVPNDTHKIAIAEALHQDVRQLFPLTRGGR